jgi:hypothetical protein
MKSRSSRRRAQPAITDRSLQIPTVRHRISITKQANKEKRDADQQDDQQAVQDRFLPGRNVIDNGNNVLGAFRDTTDCVNELRYFTCCLAL